MIRQSSLAEDDPHSKPVNSRADQAYDAIKTLILSNSWMPGFNGFEPEVAAQLGMSRTPVREALVRLEREGLIRLVPRRGAYVLPVSATDVRDIYYILAGLEASAAEQLAHSEQATNLLDGMRDAVEAMERALAARDLDAWAAGDKQFHGLLVDKSGNRRLADIVSMINDQAHRVRMLTLRLRPFPAASNGEHREIIRAIEQSDWRSASALTREHRLRGLSTVLEALDTYQFKQI